MVCNGKWSVMGNQNNIVKIGVPGFLAVPVFQGAGVFRSVPECFGVPVFRCSGVPGFSTCHSFNHFCVCCIYNACRHIDKL